MGSYVSFWTGTALLIVSLMVAKTYWPRRGEDRAATLLGLAIFIAFVSDAANALWWQMAVGGLTYLGVVDYGALRPIGLWLDGALKGSAVIAGVLHLMAVHRRLPEGEQSTYHWWDMPWYPRQFRFWR